MSNTQEIAYLLNIRPQQAETTLKLLEEGSTVPFIARYRKEATANLDETQIREIQELNSQMNELAKRKVFVLSKIEEMEKLTPALRAEIEKVKTLALLEELYAPYKSKRKTKADKAREAGAGIVFDDWLKGKVTPETVSKESYPDLTIEGAELQAALYDLFSEWVMQKTVLRAELKELYLKLGKIHSEFKPKAREVSGFEKYEMYHDINFSLKELMDPKNSHRTMAMRRAASEKILKLEIQVDQQPVVQLIKSHLEAPLKNQDQWIDKVNRVSLSTALDLDVMGELRKIADESAISVFAKNLKDLLLSPYFGAKGVIALDPGLRTGTKTVVINDEGKLVADGLIYPLAPKNDLNGSVATLRALKEKYQIKTVVIGNGTGGRDLYDALRSKTDKEFDFHLISEAGASVYSASELAKKEYPDKDVTVRGAISIGKRFQDPLAELVKIDPKSIGVGQYQHDVNQIKLKKSLNAVIEDCVNYVGVDLNTASAPLLSHVSGIGEKLAYAIVQTREDTGPFTDRSELLKVPKFGQKAFEQASGFLRIYNGKNPLDATFVHPEQYEKVKDYAFEKSLDLKGFVQSKDEIRRFKESKKYQELMGLETLNDIVDSLLAPTQDPRSELETVEFSADIREMKDLKVGSWYQGVVSNLTHFGAFIDIGLKENALAHISEISEKFISSPSEILTLNQAVKVRVIEVDQQRKRIAVSLKKEAGTRTNQAASKKQSRPPQKPKKGTMADKLAGFKV